MYMNYYARDRFPYAQGTGGPYDTFCGTPGLDNPPFSPFPIAQPGAICAAGSTKMNFYRPNQALVRGVVGGGMRGMGQTSIASIVPLAIAGVAALFFGPMLVRSLRK